MNNQLIRVDNRIINLAHVSSVRYDGDGKLSIWLDDDQAPLRVTGHEADALWRWLNRGCVFGGDFHHD